MFAGTTAQGPADEKAEGTAQAVADATESTQAVDSTETSKPEAEASSDTPEQEAESAEDWKAHARQWERRAKADRKQVESLTDAINGKDTTIEDLRAQVADLQRTRGKGSRE